MQPSSLTKHNDNETQVLVWTFVTLSVLSRFLISLFIKQRGKLDDTNVFTTQSSSGSIINDLKEYVI